MKRLLLAIVTAIVVGCAVAPVASAADTTFPDMYETPSDGHDGFVLFTNVRDITASIPNASGAPKWGAAPYTEQHTIDTATQTGWDEDWIKFTVSDATLAAHPNLSYRFDAFTTDDAIRLAIDVYRLGDSMSMADTLELGDPAARASAWATAWQWGTYQGGPLPCPCVSFEPTTSGTYVVRIRPRHSEFSGFQGKAGAYTLRVKVGNTMRLAGATRIETAVRISQEFRPTRTPASLSATAVIVYANNFPDALSAAGLAGATYGPIYLTPSDHLPPSVATELRRSGVRGAYVVGGTGVVSSTVFEELKGVVPNVKRIAGPDRYATSAAVMDEIANVQGGSLNSGFVLLASGANYPDALALGPVAYHAQVPILLTHPTTALPQVSAALQKHVPDDLVIAGAAGSVSEQVVDQLNQGRLEESRIMRLGGANRYETARMIAGWAGDIEGAGVRGNLRVGTPGRPEGISCYLSPSVAIFASGENFADALAAAAMAGGPGAPILLTPKASPTPYLFGDVPGESMSWFDMLGSASRLPVGQSYLVGGSGAVSDAVFTDIDSHTGWTP